MNTNTHTLVAELKVTCEQPLTVSLPGAKGDGKTLVKELPRIKQPEGNPTDGIVYFPSSGFKHALRAGAFRALREALVGGGRTDIFDKDDYFYLVLGGVSGSFKDDATKLPLYQAIRENNPLISVFGSGAPFLGGKLSVPLLQGGASTATIELPVVRANPFRRAPDELDWINEESKEALIQQMLKDAESSEQKTAARALKRSVKTEQDTELKKAINARADAVTEDAANVAISQALAGQEAIAPGSELTGRLILANATTLEIGLLLDAFRQFSANPRLGGRQTNGCGEVSIKGAVSQVVVGRKNFVGKLSVALGEFTLDGDFLSGALEQWEQTKADLGRFDFRQPDWFKAMLAKGKEKKKEKNRPLEAVTAEANAAA